MTCGGPIQLTTAKIAKLVGIVMADVAGQLQENLALEDIFVLAKAWQVHRYVHQEHTMQEEELNSQARAFPAQPAISAQTASIKIGKFTADQLTEVLRSLLLVEREHIKNGEASLLAICAQLVKYAQKLE